MDSYRCLIVEDEPLAAEVLRDYIQALSHLELVAICPDAIYALEYLHQKQIDVIFLDIHLPKLKGLAFAKTLQEPPQIILTTAYHQYALEAFDLEVVDYLLKPIAFGRFLKAINKLKPKTTSLPSRGFTHALDSASGSEQRPARFFNVNKKKVKVYLDEILYIESLKEYVRIYTRSHPLTTKFQLGEIEAFLDWNNLLRIHRSYLVAKDKIAAFSTTEVEVGGVSLPIGRSYKEWVLRELGNL